jgi:hypothetical protein
MFLKKQKREGIDFRVMMVLKKTTVIEKKVSLIVFVHMFFLVLI